MNNLDTILKTLNEKLDFLEKENNHLKELVATSYRAAEIILKSIRGENIESNNTESKG